MQRANVIRDRFIVIVEDNDEIFLETARVVDSFERHAAGQRAITNDGHDFEIFAPQVASYRKAKRSRDRGAGMAGAEDIIGAFFPPEIAGEATKLANGLEAVAAPGEQFVDIRLMADIPDQQVFGRIEH